MPCPKCRTPIRVPTDHADPVHEADLGKVDVREGRIASSAHSGPSSSVQLEVFSPQSSRPWWRPPSMWTPWDRFIFKVGATCVAFGVLSHLLPLIGLQFRKLSTAGTAALSAGTGVGVVGALMIAYVVSLKGRLGKIMLAMVGLVIVCFAVLLTIGYLSSNRAPRPTFGPLGPNSGAAPMGPRSAPPIGGPNGPRHAGPASPGSQSPFPQPPHVSPMPSPPPIDYDSLVARYGAERIVRVTLTGVDGVDVSATVRASIDRMDKAKKPNTWRIRTSSGVAELILAPVDDLDGIAALLDLGTVTATDTTERRLVIEYDATKEVKKRE